MLARAGRLALRRGRTTDAVPLLRQATELGSTDVETWYCFGRALLSMGCPVDAGKALQAALYVRHTRAYTYFNCDISLTRLLLHPPHTLSQ